jgi:hypothetical protein
VLIASPSTVGWSCGQRRASRPIGVEWFVVDRGEDDIELAAKAYRDAKAAVEARAKALVVETAGRREPEGSLRLRSAKVDGRKARPQAAGGLITARVVVARERRDHNVAARVR